MDLHRSWLSLDNVFILYLFSAEWDLVFVKIRWLSWSEYFKVWFLYQLVKIMSLIHVLNGCWNRKTLCLRSLVKFNVSSLKTVSGHRVLSLIWTIGQSHSVRGSWSTFISHWESFGKAYFQTCQYNCCKYSITVIGFGSRITIAYDPQTQPPTCISSEPLARLHGRLVRVSLRMNSLIFTVYEEVLSLKLFCDVCVSVYSSLASKWSSIYGNDSKCQCKIALQSRSSLFIDESCHIYIYIYIYICWSCRLIIMLTYNWYFLTANKN